MSALPARRIIITGAGSGIGREAALQLANRGDHIIVADRNTVGGVATVKAIQANAGSAEFHELDLGSLTNIGAFANWVLAGQAPLDILINNAGLLPPMLRAVTSDGFELEFGVAHLGHFALTGLLLPALLRSAWPRVVSVSSTSHALGSIDFENLHSERTYVASQAYAATKLACLMFALELQRRAVAGGRTLISVAAHPGLATTPIANGWKQENRRRLRDRFELAAYNVLMRLFGQTAAEGANSLVFAASDASVVGGGYYGPTGFKQMNGAAGRVPPSPRANDSTVAHRLWQESERLTGVHYQALTPAGRPPPSSGSAASA